MTVTLESLCDDLRTALKDGESATSLEAVRTLVEQALRDEGFMNTVMRGRTPPPERVVLFEDPDLGFCVCAHIYEGEKTGGPHDHGPTWAVYGQADGETVMTDWRIVRPASGDQPALVEEERRYTLKPGDAHAYPTGAVHAPIRHGSTMLLRIEGKNTDKVTRTKIEVAA